MLGLRGYRRSYTLPGESDRACALGRLAAQRWRHAAALDPGGAQPITLPVNAGGRLGWGISDVVVQVLGDGGGHKVGMVTAIGITLSLPRAPVPTVAFRSRSDVGAARKMGLVSSVGGLWPGMTFGLPRAPATVGAMTLGLARVPVAGGMTLDLAVAAMGVVGD